MDGPGRTVGAPELPGRIGVSIAHSDLHASMPGVIHPHAPSFWGDIEAVAETFASEYLTRKIHRIVDSRHWGELRAWAEDALGHDSFDLGVCYGLAKSPVTMVRGLAELQKTFVLAGVYD